MRITSDLVLSALAGSPAGESPWSPIIRKDARLAAVTIPIRFNLN